MVRKVILSRKGFDSTTGGKPSPIIDNKFVSLPIPRAESEVFYKNINYSATENYLMIMKDLGINFYSEAHLDPDLQRSILKERPSNWRGLFGQSGNSQFRLHDNKVGKGDIFLFFGWFKEVSKINGVWRYVKNSPDIHAIFGYLEIDEVLDIKKKEMVPSWAKYHPHIKNSLEYGNKQNAVYIATKAFKNEYQKEGWGCFNYNEKLVLTKNKSENKSLWELPPCFQNEENNFSNKMEIWNVLDNGRVEMKPKGRGDQEMFISSNPKVVSWAENLIETSFVYS